MRRKIIGTVLLCAVFVLSACGKSESTGSQPEEQETVQQEQEKGNADVEEDTESKPEASVEEDTDKPESSAEPAIITVYYSNEDATAFVSEEIQVDALSPEEVLRVLVEKGVVVPDVQILSFQETEVDGKAAIDIDFNGAFADFVSSMGSTGEYYVMGGVCNTFLKTYNCEQIKITVEGNALSTGHAEYPGYMSMYP